jgi:hypothetical protein
VPGTSSPSDHACILSSVGPGRAWIATSRLGWVVAAWVLGCRARFSGSSVKTTCDSHWDRHQEEFLAAHSISTTRVTLQSFLPPSGRDGKPHRPAEISFALLPATCQPVACSRSTWLAPATLPPYPCKRSNLRPVRRACRITRTRTGGSPRKTLGATVPGRIVLSTGWKPLEASSTDFVCRGAPRPISTECRRGFAQVRPGNCRGGDRRSRAA